MVMKPNAYGVLLQDLITKYCATDFVAVLLQFVTCVHHPKFTDQQVQCEARKNPAAVRKVLVYH